MIKPITMFVLIFDTIDPHRNRWFANEVLVEGDLDMYTDGSKSSEGTYVRVFWEELGIEVPRNLQHKCTVFQAKVHTINVAVLYQSNVI